MGRKLLASSAALTSVATEGAVTSSLCEPAADFVGDTDDAFRSTSSFDASFVNLTFREEFFCSALPDLPDAALKRTQNIKFRFLGFDTL